MKRLFLASTILFWLVLAAFRINARRPPPPPTETPNGAAPGEIRHFSLAEVAKHNQAGDCWMAIDNVVYDLTAYVPRHPTRPEVLLPWCGKDATAGWNTKGHGRPHSDYAAALLQRFRIGDLDMPQER